MPCHRITSYFSPFSILAVSYGWWRIIDPEDIIELERCLHIRGAREQQLLTNVRRSMDFCHDPSNARKLGDELTIEEVEGCEAELLEGGGGAPVPDVPGDWSREVALRVDKYILEQVEALEDKVAAASMQVPVRVT